MKKLTLLSFLLAFVFLFSGVNLAFAQTQEERGESNVFQDSSCTCFCKSADGAQNLEELADESLCRDACKTGDFYYLGCYEDEENFPVNNGLCWTQADCESADSVTTDELGSDWGGQESQCSPGMGYCYNRVKPIQLGQAIDGVSEVGSFSQYISLIYAYLIPAASLLAIVLLMVGGLEYMLAAGKPAGIEKAKNRIKNALIGLVILLGAYSIAYLIDPNLVSFNELRIPRVRTVTYLDQDSSCEAIEQKGGIVQPISTTQGCGFEGRILSLEAVSGESKVVGIEEGGTCMYHFCEDSIATCTSTPSAETKFSCIRCYNASEVIEDITESDCRRLVHRPLDKERNVSEFSGKDEQFYCMYDGRYVNECYEVVYPKNSNSLNCDVLRQNARDQGSESCRAYDLLFMKRTAYVFGEARYDRLDDIWIGEKGAIVMVTPALIELCVDDPCNLAPPGGSCVISADDVFAADLDKWMDCVNSGYLDAVEASYDSWFPYNLGARETSDLPLSPYYRKVIDVNGDPAEFNWTW